MAYKIIEGELFEEDIVTNLSTVNVEELRLEIANIDIEKEKIIESYNNRKIALQSKLDEIEQFLLNQNA